MLLGIHQAGIGQARSNPVHALSALEKTLRCAGLCVRRTGAYDLRVAEALSAKTVETAATESLSFIRFSVSPKYLRPRKLVPVA